MLKSRDKDIYDFSQSDEWRLFCSETSSEKYKARDLFQRGDFSGGTDSELNDSIMSPL